MANLGRPGFPEVLIEVRGCKGGCEHITRLSTGTSSRDQVIEARALHQDEDVVACALATAKVLRKLSDKLIAEIQGVAA